ncbi:DUF6166 domain-containing protein [Patulibacter defluvii]|uniref:DUF6166 domain-containing protein n=1 Tax=Patulibacter defluvii TaxID=3095358 RepID=UPI002A751985|nr:DUF6166 domain-containing protein [Patulibacter sp. DM4]
MEPISGDRALSRSRPRPRPGPWPARPAGLRPAWFYVGRRRGPEVLVVSGAAVERLAHREYRSPAPFAWGAGASWLGRVELAFALLADLSGRRPPDAVAFALYGGLVGRLPAARFVLSEVELERWLARAGHDPLAWAP